MRAVRGRAAASAQSSEAGFLADDAFVDEMQLGVRARTNDRAHVKHLVGPHFEQRRVRAGARTNERGVPSQDLPVVALPGAELLRTL